MDKRQELNTIIKCCLGNSERLELENKELLKRIKKNKIKIKEDTKTANLMKKRLYLLEKEESLTFEIGDKVIFEGDKLKFNVRALNERFIICTTKTSYYYTIVDLDKKIRGRHNKIFNPYNFKKDSDLEKLLKDLETGFTEVSGKNSGHAKLGNINFI